MSVVEAYACCSWSIRRRPKQLPDAPVRGHLHLKPLNQSEIDPPCLGTFTSWLVVAEGGAVALSARELMELGPEALGMA